MVGFVEDEDFQRGSGILQAADFQKLLDSLLEHGYRVIGPQVRDGAVVYDELLATEQLPCGYTDEQKPGEYRLSRSDSDRYFDYVVGPQNWKRFLYPPRRKLWDADRDGSQWQPSETVDDYTPSAFLGVRACDIAAIRVLDRILLNDTFQDPLYASRRRNSLIVAIDCVKPASTCFCLSMGGGPAPDSGFDLALSELGTAQTHRFFVRSGSSRGAEILTSLSLAPVTDADRTAVASQLKHSEEAMTGAAPMNDARELLQSAWTSKRWDEVAERCLTCANCTMACPTCFCVDVEDVTDLSGAHAERWQQWDSCFTLSHSYLHGGSVRKTAASRYRQWMTHKLSTWHDQFGSSGCVGCGRCITWCPVGIDIREELSAIRTEALVLSGEGSKS